PEKRSGGCAPSRTIPTRIPGVVMMCSTSTASLWVRRWTGQSTKNGKKAQTPTEPRLHFNRADDRDQLAADPDFGRDPRLQSVDSARQRIGAEAGLVYPAPSNRSVHARQAARPAIAGRSGVCRVFETNPSRPLYRPE